MKIEFCPKCGKKMEYGVKEGKLLLICPKCGYSKEASPEHTYESYRPEERVTVVEEDITPMPTVNIECPKCGYREAYTWSVQTRSGDESETQFFKCKKCGYTWRLYT